jgi:hypothetical protein
VGEVLTPSEEVDVINPIARITVVLATILLAGCGPFFALDTFRPGQGRIVLTPEPTMIDLAPAVLAPGVAPADYPQVTLQVQAMPGFRGATLKAYSVTYHEMNGTEISGAALPKRDFAPASALPASTEEAPARVSFTVPLIHAGVTEFLRTQPPGSTINSRVTAHGADTEGNEIAFSLNVPIRTQQP